MQILALLRYSILGLILWALPSYFLAYYGSALGAISSYLSIALLLLYFILESNKGSILKIFILLGLLYYLIAGLNYKGLEEREYFVDIIKYLFVIIGGAVLLRKSTLKEIYIFLLIGALSIVVNALVFPLANANFYPTYGRFSGFYLNPNHAGAICLIGFALSFGIKNKKLKYIGQIIFSIGGFFTLSRYFLLMWLLINFLSVLVNRKNIIIPIIGALVLVFIFAFSNKLSLKADRFEAYKSIFSSEKVDTQTLNKDSRGATWALYYSYIMDKPFFGNGYQKFQNQKLGIPGPGVHNTYLLVIGEAGILPFLLIIGLYVFFLIKGYQNFKQVPHLSMLSIVLFTALLVTHNYFDKYTLLLVSIYLYLAFTEKVRHSIVIEPEEKRNRDNLTIG